MKTGSCRIIHLELKPKLSSVYEMAGLEVPKPVRVLEIRFAQPDYQAFLDSKEELKSICLARFDPEGKYWYVTDGHEPYIKEWADKWFKDVTWDYLPVESQPEFTCPCCLKATHNKHDIKHKYCVICGWFAGDGYPCPKHGTYIEALLEADIQVKRRRFRLDNGD